MNTRKNGKVHLGVFWSAIERFSSQGIQFVISIILARLLLPQDYGIIAIAMIIVTILQGINDAEFGVALMHKLDRDDLDISTVFIFNIVLGIFLYVIVFFTSPLIAAFFKEPALTVVNRLLGLSLIINSFVSVPRTLLFIKVDFKTMSKASIIASIMSGIIAIGMANYGYREMSLIVQFIIYNLVNLVIIFFYVKQYPSFRFSFERFKPIFNYTYKLLGARLLKVIFAQGYPLIIGKYYSISQLGYYNRALSFQSISSNNITQIIQRVSTPLLCEVQHSKEDLKRVLIKFIRLAMMIVLPLSCGIFILAEPLITTILTEKWLFTATVLKIICPISVFYVFNTFNRNLFNATGRTDLALKSEIIKKLIIIPIAVGLIFLSFKTMIFGLVIIEIIDFFISTHYTKKQIELSAWEQIKSMRDLFGMSLVMSLVIIVSTMFIENNFWKLFTGTILGALTYFLLVYVFNIFEIQIIVNRNFKELINILKKNK